MKLPVAELIAFGREAAAVEVMMYSLEISAQLMRKAMLGVRDHDVH
jgi:hypothetical protein